MGAVTDHFSLKNREEFSSEMAQFAPTFQQGIPHSGYFHDRRNGEEKAYIAIFTF
jgi:hypothetical protein